MTAVVLHGDDYSVTQSMEVSTLQEAHQRMAVLDDAQILSACQGAVIKQWQYTFKIGGQEVSGISVTGAMEIARIRGESGRPVRWVSVTPQPVVWNGREGLTVTVTARDQRTGAEAVAMVFEPWFDDKGRPNQFVERKALSKAKRNCILDLIPETQILELLKIAKDFANGRKAQAAVSKPRQEVIAGVKTPPPAGQVENVTYDSAEAKPPLLELATAEQMAQIAKLLEHPSIPPEKKSATMGKLEGGGYETFAAAQRVIDQLSQYITARK